MLLLSHRQLFSKVTIEIALRAFICLWLRYQSNIDKAASPSFPLLIFCLLPARSNVLLFIGNCKVNQKHDLKTVVRVRFQESVGFRGGKSRGWGRSTASIWSNVKSPNYICSRVSLKFPKHSQQLFSAALFATTIRRVFCKEWTLSSFVVNVGFEYFPVN